MTDHSVDASFPSDDHNERFTIKWGLWAALRICGDDNVKTVLDIGTGQGEHARLMRHFGKEVYTNDWKTESDYAGDIMNIDFDRQFDAVLCSHVLEHQRNVGLFLDKLVSLVRDDGLIAIAVPAQSPHAFVTGHVSVWSLRLLAYNLMQAGLDCHQGQGLLDNECTFVVRKKPIDPNAIAEKNWQDTNSQSGKAHSEDVTLPWHDDLTIIHKLLPFTSGQVDSPQTHNMNWPDHLQFPIPANTKDIQILTSKQPEPLTLYYDAICSAHQKRAS